MVVVHTHCPEVALCLTHSESFVALGGKKNVLWLICIQVS